MEKIMIASLCLVRLTTELKGWSFSEKTYSPCSWQCRPPGATVDVAQMEEQRVVRLL